MRRSLMLLVYFIANSRTWDEEMPADETNHRGRIYIGLLYWRDGAVVDRPGFIAYVSEAGFLHPAPAIT
jgi:hypothetical protein